MFTRILIATDGSPLARRAARRGLAMAVRMGAEVMAFTVVPDWHVFSLDPKTARESLQRFDKRNRRAAEAALAQIGREAAALGVRCRTKQARSDQPWKEILGAAKRWRADLVVVGSHGHGSMAGLILGSQAHKVLTHCKVPVMVCR